MMLHPSHGCVRTWCGYLVDCWHAASPTHPSLQHLRDWRLAPTTASGNPSSALDTASRLKESLSSDGFHLILVIVEVVIVIAETDRLRRAVSLLMNLHRAAW